MSDDVQLLQKSVEKAVSALKAQGYKEHMVSFACDAYKQNTPQDSSRGGVSACLISLVREFERNKLHFISIIRFQQYPKHDALVVAATTTALEAARSIYPSDYIPNIPLAQFITLIEKQSALKLFEATRPKTAARPTGFEFKI